MKISMKLLTILISIIALMSLSCASQMVEVLPGAERVSTAEAKQVTGCVSMGKVTTSVISKVWFISRSAIDVEENLLQMARNAAAEDGGDTLVRGESSVFGKRTFAMYKCRP